ncbi:sugar phosphate isomerase/epimerase family protein [Bacillus sp. NSP9.1]|uniref:sugar phosphate isomerase/epimerase family protein n=1 Tax=Bacillus sp. NSP9.1 TaxID=1071078 RepID=UPI000402313D|nr:sugar phosphate isomerase/epimerase [Bacillus sp. NSP9.1]QHZ48467.1 sugar phosphate isomerase/epimerase [Bacillus sp. NSP9.1]
MKIGISTYAFRWSWQPEEASLDLFDMLQKTREFEGEVFQICDYPGIEKMDKEELLTLRETADELGIELELGTQGIHPDHLRKYLEIAHVLNSKVLRSMVHGNGHQPDNNEAVKWLKEISSDFEHVGVKLALETYEPVKTADLIQIVKAVNHSNIGICLDPGNSISELEFPDDVIRNTAPFVTNVHFKDFIFRRREGSIGFYLTGAPVGEGQLNLDFLLQTLKNEQVNVSGIIELWLPFTDTYEKTVEIQYDWIRRSINYLKRVI